MKQETNDDNFEDHFTFLIEEKQNDESLQQKIKDENQDFSIERIREKIKDDFAGNLIEEVFLYKRYIRCAELPEKYTTKQHRGHLKYIECIEYMHDKKLNEFIIFILTFYPIYFTGIQQRKKRLSPKTIDKSLEILFLEDATTKNYSDAVRLLLKKQQYNDDNDELMQILNSLYYRSSLHDMDKMLKEDIKVNVDDKKVNTKNLKKYLKAEIELRIKNYDNKTLDFGSKTIKEEQKLVLYELEQALGNGVSMENFWNSF